MLSEHPIIMGILNLTPDSFSDGGRYPNTTTAMEHIDDMISAGAEIIDIGGESTRPDAHPIDLDTEWARIKDVLACAAERNITVSVDTYKPIIAERALELGIKIINDIATFDHLEEMILIAKKYFADLVVTHNSRKKPFNNSDELVLDVVDKFKLAINTAETLNFDPSHLIFDIGLGFGKTNEQDIELLRRLHDIRAQFSQRFLIGASRKSFMRIFGEQASEHRIPCTLACTLSTYLSGCDIFRVHDVRENYEVLKFAQAVYGR